MSRFKTFAVGAGAALSAAAWAVRGRSSTVFAPSVWRGESGKGEIALTFDDGPSLSTPAILETLAKHNVPATFFQCGVNVGRHPQIAREVLSAGHEIGNHSQTHPNFAGTGAQFIESEFANAQAAIYDATGARPVWLRAPLGVRWFGFREMQRRLGMTGVMWTVIGRDWTLSAHQITRRVVSKVRDGGIVCLHDGRLIQPRPDIGETIEAVHEIVPRLIDEGYRLVTVSQLCLPPTSPASK